MPRPKKAGAPEPKRRSRAGCWPCKGRKVKCDERRPNCVNCEKLGETCDYSIRLNWEGRGKKNVQNASGTGHLNFSAGMINFGLSTVSTRPEVGAASPPETSPRSTLQTLLSESLASPVHGEQELLVPHPYDTESGLHSHSFPTNPMSDRMHYGLPSVNPILTDALPAAEQWDSVYGNFQRQAQVQDSYYDGIHHRHEHHRPPQSREGSRLNPAYDSSHPSDSGLRNLTAIAFDYRSLTTADKPTSKRSSLENDIDDRSHPRSNMTNSNTKPEERAPKRVCYQYNQYFNRALPLSLDTTVRPRTDFSAYSMKSPLSSSPCIASPPSSDFDVESRKRVDSLSLHEGLDSRRLSVNSLLSEPPGMPPKNARKTAFQENVAIYDRLCQRPDHEDTIRYGIDRGFKDLDIGRNDDMNAITGSSPIRDHVDIFRDELGEGIPTEFGFGETTSNTVESGGGYYDKPVPICIPRALDPLPSKLHENPMNLLYFHHFINHTAGCLLPHNCSSNPFRSVLPQMAVRDENLLNLLLAYSASHRARLLRQPEPATRIALWVQDIFPNLRRALCDPNEIITNSNLATAIMLASLEIISPKAFGISVPWQKHLDVARQMIAARGGAARMKGKHTNDKVSSFLWSWFAYLDVLGSLSGGKSSVAATPWISDLEIDDENDYQIDCILGFTSRCIRVLARIAELSRICDSERIGPDTKIRPEWKPSEITVTQAKKLEADLAESRLHPAKPCTHMQFSGKAAYHRDSLEMAATNEAFHWAGHVHLHRRVLGKSSQDPDVQLAVNQISDLLFKVRRGSSAEGCLLFPIFTAGCEIRAEKKRADILERIKGVEKSGMTQVHTARTLMERVWETGRPWETLVAGEFFG